MQKNDHPHNGSSALSDLPLQPLWTTVQVSGNVI
jgi:hypothetical protein